MTGVQTCALPIYAVIKAAVSAIDSAKSKGVIHKNTAARKVARMAKRNNKVSAAQ